jgi:hypothetical protein
MEHDLDARRRAWQAAQDALDSSAEWVRELDAERPARERRAANAGIPILGDSADAVAPPERVPTAERRGRRDWQAESEWVRQIALQVVAGERAMLAQGIGQAIAGIRREIETDVERRLLEIRAEITALVAELLRDVLRHVGSHNVEVIAAVDQRMARLDQMLDGFARSTLDAWPSRTVDGKPN